ncbi:MAG: hypothetical protein RLZZ227_2428 [Pseudomonadota bacterium]
MPLNNAPLLSGRLQNRLLWTAVVVLGAICNLIPVTLFIGVMLLLGETAIILLAARFSMAAAVFGAAIVSLPAYLHWGHLWPTVSYVTEAVFLSIYFGNRHAGVGARNLLILLFVYSLTVGGIQTFIIYKYASGLPSITAQVMVLRAALNSILCGILYLFIDILFRYNSSNPDSFPARYFLPRGNRNFSVDFKEVVSLIATSIVILPLIILMTFHNRARVNGHYAAEQATIEAVSLFAALRLQRWLTENLQNPACMQSQYEGLTWLRADAGIWLFCRGDTQRVLFDGRTARAMLAPLDGAGLLRLETYDFTLGVTNGSNLLSTVASPELLVHRRMNLGGPGSPLIEMIGTAGNQRSILALLNTSSMAFTRQIVPGSELSMTVSEPMTEVQEWLYFAYRSAMLYSICIGLAFMLAGRFLLAELMAPLARVSQAFSTMDPANPLATLNIQWPRSAVAQIQAFIDKLRSIIGTIESAALEREALVNEMLSLMHNANTPIFGVDKLHGIIVWNHKMVDVTGFTAAEAEGAAMIEDFVTPAMKAQVQMLLNDAFEGRPTRNLEIPFVKKNGDHVELLLNFSLRRNALGHIVSVVCLGQDMTQLKAAQSQLVQASKLASIGEMATSVAHELNQPLNVIRMAAANCQRKIEKGLIDCEFLTEKLDRINSQVERAAQIIDHMRMFGRVAPDELEPLDVPSVVRSALDMLREQLRLEQVELHTDLQEVGMPVLGKNVQLEQVILNLVSNARDALTSDRSRRKKWISVSVRRTMGNAEIIVEDNAGGVPSDLLVRIFDPFFTTKPVGKGTGLGLSISKKIIQDMKGSIRVENTAVGARFMIVLPEQSMVQS